ncbi:hypothetical protein B566_EDAN014835 [Ephemera danica]|nr:hypothetical protein B566_EDAN014835 [Ephemera danica]
MFQKKIQHEGHCSDGLIVDTETPFLGASPDRLIKVNGELHCVEIKCPFRLFNSKQKIKNAFDYPKFYLHKDVDKNAPFLRPDNEFFSQVQAEMQNALSMSINDENSQREHFEPPTDRIAAQHLRRWFEAKCRVVGGKNLETSAEAEDVREPEQDALDDVEDPARM